MTKTQPMPMFGDRCLSVRQPWAWLIIHGHKRFENRSRATKHRGRIWVHSSLSLGLRDWSEIVGGSSVPIDEGITLDDGTHLPALSALPRGMILGSVEIADCQHFADLPKRDQRDPFAEGPWCYLLREPQALAYLLAATGALGFWTWKGA